jgi:iron complex outermembrane recepter protein
MNGFKHGPVTGQWAGLLGACGASGLALMVGMASSAYAQSAAPAAAPAVADASQIEAIVVTAQHKPEYEKDVPIAVSSLSAATLEAISAGGDDIRFLAGRVPGLNVESSFGRAYPRFYIRGLGNSDFTLNAQQPVSVVYDDVAMENPILKSFPVFDVQDVEVLRGPQGTLFGRNTPAGVVKIDTVKPNDETSGYADLSYGSYNSVDFNGAFGGAIIKNLLDFRVSVLEERRDDWVTNINPNTQYNKNLEGYSDFAARAQLLYKPTNDLDALFEFDARSLDGTARLFRANVIEKGTNDLIPGFNVNQININGDNYQNLGTFGTHLTVNDDIGPVTLTSISAYEHGSVRSRGDVSGGNFIDPPPVGTAGQGFPDETSDTIPGLDQISEELRFATNGTGRFFNQGGFYYFHEYLKANDYDYTPAGAEDIFATQTQSTQSFGVFDSATYKVTEDLTLGAGIRFSADDKTYSVGCIFGCAVPSPSKVSVSDSQPTFDVSATYAVTPDTNVYGRIATGYLAPALDGRNTEFDFGNALAGSLSEAKAETTTSYEIGLKSALWDHRANLNLTGYYWTTDNLQLTAVGGAANNTILLNASTVIGEGVEASFEVKPIENLFLTANASYNFTQIQDPNLEVSPCGGGCTMQNPIDPVTGNAKINGNPLPNAPRWIYNVTARYSVPLQNDHEIYALTDWSYRGSEDFFLYKATEFNGQSLLLGGLRVGYVDHDNGWEVAGFVHNILDQVKVTGAIDFDNLTGFVNDPRTFGGEIRVKF